MFPVYYARMPLIVERILKRLRISEDTYVFSVASHGGAPANVLLKLKKTLTQNGGHLDSGFLIKMPANNIFAYNTKDMHSYNSIFQEEKNKIELISKIVREKKNHPCEISSLVIDRIIDKVFIKQTDKIMKDLPKRDEKFWVSDSCNGCKTCVRVCSVNNIEFIEGKPIWKHNYEQCTACLQYCPKEAIQWGKRTLKRKRYRNPNIKMV